jgi:hypothetical protein
MIEEIDKDALAALCAELRAILDMELAAGNTIAEVSRGSGKPDAVYVALQRPFQCQQLALPPSVAFREINDPHWWKAEYEHAATGDLLVCRFRWTLRAPA